MPNYQNGKIYKIISPSNPDMLPYFGATTQKLCSRMTTHRTSSLFCRSKELIGCGDAKIVLVENYPCNNKEELSRQEAQYILNNDCCNKMIPFRPPEYLKEYQQKYRSEHKEYMKEYNKQYSKQYRSEHKDDIEYKEKLKKNHKEWIDKNKEQQKQYMKERNKVSIICECGRSYTPNHKQRHFKSNKHISYMSPKGVIGNQKTEV